MAEKGGGRGAEIRMEAVLRDGSMAGEYRLAPPWERCTEPTGGGAAAGSAEATASGAAVPAQVARLVLTIVSAGNTSSLSLLPPGEGGEASSAQGQGTSSLSLEIHPTNDRAILRVFRIAGSRKKWSSTGVYTLCSVSAKESLPSVLGDQAVQFSVRRCEGLTFPPFGLNFKQDFNSMGPLGKGTEGKVYRCSAKFAEYMCAVKEVVPSNLMITTTNSEPRDVSILAQLNHPHIIKLHLAWNETGRDLLGRSADITFTSMLLCNRTLTAYLKKASRLKSSTANNIFKQMVMGLQHAHSHQIVHRDLKPDNILMDDENLRIIISDFGTAERKETPNSMLNPGVMGSLPYSAPEVTNYHEHHDEKADIFPAGIIYYELFIPVAADRERKVKEMSRLTRQAMGLWASWTEFDLESALKGTDLLDEWAGDFSLLKLMLHPDGSKRPSASDILAKLPVTNTSEGSRRN